MTPLTGPVPIAAEYEVESFDCGESALDDFLQRFALVNARNGASRTYVGLRENRVVGYYSLAAASVEPEALPMRATQGLSRNPVPMILLARLAVDRSEQGNGLGKGLLKDALRRYLAAQEIIGSRGLLVHAKDESAREFYLRQGFMVSPTDDLHLCLLTKDIRRTLG